MNKIRTKHPRFARIARLLHAADLPATRRGFFDGETVRKRFAAVKATQLAHDIDQAVRLAFAGVRPGAATQEPLLWCPQCQQRVAAVHTCAAKMTTKGARLATR